MDTCLIAPYKGSSGSLDFTRLQLESGPRMKPFLAGKPSPREWPRFPPGTLPCAMEELHGTGLCPTQLHQHPRLSPQWPWGAGCRWSPPKVSPLPPPPPQGPGSFRTHLFRSALCIKGCKRGFPCPAGSFTGLDATPTSRREWSWWALWLLGVLWSFWG